jgi:hypothetical protein
MVALMRLVDALACAVFLLLLSALGLLCLVVLSDPILLFWPH